MSLLVTCLSKYGGRAKQFAVLTIAHVYVEEGEKEDTRDP
jgi:hypothetical protein